MASPAASIPVEVIATERDELEHRGVAAAAVGPGALDLAGHVAELRPRLADDDDVAAENRGLERGVARAALALLYQRRVNILGLALNAVAADSSEYYYYKYKSYFS